MEEEEQLGRPAEEAAGNMESEVEEMEARAAELREEVDDLKSDWQRKQDDPGVPGADPAEEDDAGDEEPA